MVSSTAVGPPLKMPPNPSLVMRPARMPNSEIVHFIDSATGDFIESRGHVFHVGMAGKIHRITLPLSVDRRILAINRLGRRALRLDKANAVFVENRSAVVFAYQGVFYRWTSDSNELVRTGTLKQCRNVLHQGVAVVDENRIFIGEYGHNAAREAVPIWCSPDAGRSWSIVHEFPARTIKHVHGVYPDPFSSDLWIPTGDFEGECFLYRTDPNFSRMEKFGDGSQTWRTVSLLFEPDRICWIMDSQLETSHLFELDRRTGVLRRGRSFPGPVWYVKQLQDNFSVAQTTVEIGPGVRSDSAHLFVSRDNETWIEVAKFKKDLWPMRYFKFGVLAFADGPQTSQNFALFGEALQGFDGQARICSLQWP
jgi:hypothetical protein